MGGKPSIFDAVRKKWLVLTPEEWVRQHLISYLVIQKKYPASRIAIEKEIRLNDLQKRFDIVVFDRNVKPLLIVECKAPYIEIDSSVMQQALRYNLEINATFVMISNGITDKILSNGRQIDELPEWEGD